MAESRQSRASWRAGVVAALVVAALGTGTNVAINYTTTQATTLRWVAVVVLTVASGLATSLIKNDRDNNEVRALDKPAVHPRITEHERTIDFKIYSEEVALQPGYISQWIRTAHGNSESSERNEGSE